MPEEKDARFKLFKINKKAPPTVGLKVDSKKFCYFPFAQMLMQPTGVISPCCWNQDFVAGDIQNEKIMDIWNGEKMRGLREEFLAGKPVTCEKQMRHMSCHLWSHRLANKGIELSAIQKQGPKRLDLRLNGRCNLKCVMCDVWQQPNGLYDKSDFWQVAPTEIFPHLVELDILGGEPLIQQDTYRLIREVSDVNTDCTWSFVSNGQYKLGSVVKSHLDRIKIRWIQISLDSLDLETYKAIRPGAGDLKRVLSTIGELIQYRYERLLERRSFEIIVSICVQKKNWHELDEFLTFIKEMKLKPAVQFAYIPDSESLLTLDVFERKKILEKIEELLSKHPEEYLMPVIHPLKDSLKVNALSAHQSLELTEL